MVDADTAAAVFDKCILKAMRGRTVILATRHLQVRLAVWVDYSLGSESIMRSMHVANKISLCQGMLGILLDYFGNSENCVEFLVRQLLDLQEITLVSFYLF
jgi:hypothetical protein